MGKIMSEQFHKNRGFLKEKVRKKLSFGQEFRTPSSKINSLPTLQRYNVVFPCHKQVVVAAL